MSEQTQEQAEGEQAVTLAVPWRDDDDDRHDQHFGKNLAFVLNV